jgi:hypothetical protein
VEKSILQSTSFLRSGEVSIPLRAKNIALEIGDPLSSVESHVEITNGGLHVGSHESPVEPGIEIDEVRR